jgi:hypothetical protein
MVNVAREYGSVHHKWIDEAKRQDMTQFLVKVIMNTRGRIILESAIY